MMISEQWSYVLWDVDSHFVIGEIYKSIFAMPLSIGQITVNFGRFLVG